MSDTPVAPLRVEAGRAVVDAHDRVVLSGHRVTEDFKPTEGTLKRGLNPADTDAFVRELVACYNAHPVLVGLISTIIREMSPASSPAFCKTDIARIYFHLVREMKNIGITVTEPGGPAILEIPVEDLNLDPKDVWNVAWLEGYNTAWGDPGQQLKGGTDETVDNDD